MSTLIRSLPLRRESDIDDKALMRILKVTGGITSGIFSIMSQLAIAAIESGEERIMSRDVLSGGRLQAVLGESV
ncbi:hypothetical protein [uncultured Roseobacter sp.]|uniref:hypothetical protein n=1 Tax=uncultured Roseobacter sp. TaxID=114847 RepID=UPI00261201EA|nr:hypothetical protein [uncultured Roseobacter sp.]